MAIEMAVPILGALEEELTAIAVKAPIFPAMVVSHILFQVILLITGLKYTVIGAWSYRVLLVLLLPFSW